MPLPPARPGREGRLDVSSTTGGCTLGAATNQKVNDEQQPSVPLAVALAAALFVIDSLAWRFVSALFDRERLLSRYGS
jgi:hypothetical protein